MTLHARLRAMVRTAERTRRVLLVTVDFGVPPRSGRERRCWQHVVALRQLADVGVLVLDRRDHSTERPDGLSWWRYSPSPWPEERTQWMARPDGHPAYGNVPPAALAALDAALREFDPELVVVAGLWLHRHLDRLVGSGRQVVLDAADVEGPLQERIVQAEHGGARAVGMALARRVTEIEGHAVASVDQVWAGSEHDAELIRALYPAAAPVVAVPNTVDVESFQCPFPISRPEAPTVVFPATFGYPPNAEAAMTLITEVHPLVRRRFPAATLTLVGLQAGPPMQAAAAEAPGVMVTGAVPDTRPFLWRSTVMAAPLRQGSGTRIKLLEAFAAGLPVVTTAKGAEGLDIVDGEHALLVETPRQFADAITCLHEDRAPVGALVARARRLVESRYSTAAACHAVETALAQVPLRTAL